MRIFLKGRGLFVLLTLSFCAMGCGPAQEQAKVDSELVSGYRTQFVLSTEPSGAISILDLRAKMEGVDDSHDEHDHAESDHHDSEHADPDHDAADHHGDADHDHGEDADHDHDDGHDHDSADHDHGESSPPRSEEGDVDHDHDAHGGASHDHGEDGSEAHAESTPAIEAISNITLVGKIAKESEEGGVEASDFPWQKGQALFVIVDPAAEGEVDGHHHKDGEECPFCAKKKIEAQAIVQFNQEDGRPIAIDARELLGLDIGDIIVVQGDARLAGGVLMIDGTSLYVRR